jgi:hypothetical protein
MSSPQEDAPLRSTFPRGPGRLEERYRGVLRLLPAGYRARWEEEMVAAFLESMERDDPDEAEFLRDYGRPSWSEMGSVAALAVRLRLGGAGTPRSAAWGAAVRLAALIALLATAAFQPHERPARTRPWLWALPVGAVALTAFLIAGSATAALLDWGGLQAVLVVAAALAYLGGAALRLVRPAPAWSLALLVLTVAALAPRLVTLLDYALLDGQAAWLAAGAALLAVGAPLAFLAARALPRSVPT